MREKSRRFRWLVVAILILIAAVYLVAHDVSLGPWIIVGLLWMCGKPGLYNGISKRTDACALITGALFAIFTWVGSEIANTGTVENLFRLDCLVRNSIRLAGLVLLFWSLLRGFLHAAEAMQPSETESCKPSFLLLWTAIFVCWLPYFIAYYPGLLSPDSLSEISIVLGERVLSNHHPIIHQWTIAPFILLGKSIGSLDVGVACYSLFQMFVMSGVFAAALWYLGQWNVPLLARAILFVFYACLTIHGYYSVTMWKDIIFAASVLAVMILLIKAQKEEGKKQKLSYWILLTVAFFLFCTYRNNGKYAFLVSIPFYIFFNRKSWKQLLSVAVIVMVLVTSYETLIFDVLHAQKSRVGEMLSVPLQQVVRTIKYHRKDMTEEERLTADELFGSMIEAKNAYKPYISDPVKAMMNTKAFEKDPMRYIRLWAELGMKHPKVYLDAFLNQCYGYWYPDVEYWNVTQSIYENPYGLAIQASELRHHMSSLHANAQKLSLIGSLYHPGTYTWIALLASGVLFVKKRSRMMSPMIFLLALWLTTLLSPVYAEFRYVYGIVVAAPFYLVAAMYEKSKKPGA